MWKKNSLRKSHREMWEKKFTEKEPQRDVENKGKPHSTKVGWGINISYPLLCLTLLHLYDNRTQLEINHQEMRDAPTS